MLVKLGDRLINLDMITQVEKHNGGTHDAPRWFLRITFNSEYSQQVDPAYAEALWETLCKDAVDIPSRDPETK